VIEFLIDLVIEVGGQVLFELAAQSLTDAIGPEREARPAAAGSGHLIMGLCAGAVSLGIVRHRLTPHSPVPGLSLVLSPIATGLVMDAIGRLWRDRGDRPALFTFRGGAVFAFGMALVRFVFFVYL
jgi:hypothetical protein